MLSCGPQGKLLRTDKTILIVGARQGVEMNPEGSVTGLQLGCGLGNHLHACSAGNSMAIIRTRYSQLNRETSLRAIWGLGLRDATVVSPSLVPHAKCRAEEALYLNLLMLVPRRSGARQRHATLLLRTLHSENKVLNKFHAREKGSGTCDAGRVEASREEIPYTRH